MSEKEPKYLSNEELVEEYHKIDRPSWTRETSMRRNKLKEEILRRLNDIWRKL